MCQNFFNRCIDIEATTSYEYLSSQDYSLFLRLSCRMRNRSLVSEREYSLAWSFGRSLGRKLLFLFPLTNAQLHLTKRKMSSNGSANVKHSEAMSDEI